jgi:UDP-N-acetylglucosamine 2-epimerase
VTGTKPDFYKQAPLVSECARQNLPVLVIDTGQHYDDILGHGMVEFGIQDTVGCTLQIRGNLMEKASELLLKFATFGKICKNRFPENPILPIVHGDTLVAAISPLSWLFGLGQKVAQNEAGLRSMSPEVLKSISLKEPDKYDIENFIHLQFDENKWFLTREEPFPEQVDTWICSAGTQYFFAPTALNKRNLIREGYPEESVYIVGNSVVDAIDMKRRYKPEKSIFEIYPRLSSSSRFLSQSGGSSLSNIRNQWIRVDIHRRENLTRRRFLAIVEALIRLVKLGYRIILVKLTATQYALAEYRLTERLDELETEFPHNFIQTDLWKEYGHVIEFLDSGECWLELTDSGSMQEELLYFPKVNSVTVRLNTDRPETIFEANGNILAPPISPEWIVEIVRLADDDKIPFLSKGKKMEIYGRPGEVSQKIIRILKKHFEEDYNIYPWLHQRLGLWTENGKDTSFL